MRFAEVSFARLLPLLAVLGVLAIAAGIGCTGNQASATQTDGGSEPSSAPTHTAHEEVRGDPGISDAEILFGQSAAFTGPAQELGQEMRNGILAAFEEANRAGGIHGRQLVLESLNDAYETDYAVANTRRLIDNDEVFALIGAVGTPTSRAASPLAHAAGVPFIAPFTGAEFLRDPRLDNVLNLRASYYQETEEMVARLTEDLDITEVAVLYQDDAYGRTGLQGVESALERRGLATVASSHYERNTSAVKSAVVRIIEADPQAVILIGAHEPVARTIELIQREIDPVFLTVSFVGSNALARELGDEGEGVYVTQVVPLPDDDGIPVVARYRAALAAFDSDAEPGFVSMEGYLAGRLAIAGLEACGRELSRNCLITALHDPATVNIDGMQLQYGPRDNQGSDTVFLTMIGADGKYRQVDKLADIR